MDLPTTSVEGNTEAVIASPPTVKNEAERAVNILDLSANRSPAVNQCQSGPWGTLEYYDTFLEAPNSLVERLALPSQHTVWNFESATEERLSHLFENVGLNKTEQKALMDRSRWAGMPNGIRVFPPHNVLENLRPASRGAIYGVLALSEMNPFHRDPFVFDRIDLRAAVARSHLPDSLINMLSKFTFRMGNTLHFCDLPHFLRYLSHPQEEKQFLRILTRARSLILRLNLDGDEDLKGVRDYWSSNAQLVQTLPLIESIVVARGVDTLDLIHLLPPSPRSQIYTFPSHEDCISGRAPDSVWTALNFFNHQAIPVYAESSNLEAVLRSGYVAVKEPFSYGDVLFLKQSDDMGVGHACVYIADEIVYTKNSASLLSPWIFSTLEDVTNRQVRRSEIEMRAWRRK